jgi:oligoribonuclease
LLHLLVSKGKTEGVKYLISKKFNLETQRGDGNTPLHLSAWTKNPELIATLVDAKVDPSIQNKYGEDCKSIIETRERMDNLVWLDFELTSLPIEDPDILECAVIITDKNLNEIERSHWIVHYDQERLDTLSAWHQKEFCDVKSGGNGLFADVLASTTTFEAFQDELMALLLKHCPPKACSLAGSSVHCDREVLLKKMPVVYKHLSHQIIDVSTLYGLMRRWKPEELSALTAASKSAEDQVPVDWHRAMADIERSLASLKMFGALFGQSF